MSHKIRQITHYLTLIVLLTGVLLVSTWPPAPAFAGGGEGGGAPNLPPRLPPPQDPGQRDQQRQASPKRASPAGAYIELQAGAAPAGTWSGVQWQDKGGQWHDVEGWQGFLEADGSKRWWVSPTDFGQGPFRWVVTAYRGGPFLSASTSFHLPATADQIIRRKVSLAGP
jgi:hypothetical protein